MYKLHKWEIQFAAFPPDKVLPAPINLAVEASMLAIDCTIHGFDNALAKCQRIDEECRANNMVKPITYGYAHNLLKDLRERLEDDFDKHIFLHVSLADSASYRKSTKGWEPVITRFPDTRSDVEECTKCYALNRYAASVFHAMQIVEHGLIALGTFLQVSDPKSGWTAVCGELKKCTRDGYQKSNPSVQRHWSFLEQIQTVAETMKNGWRNKIDHAHNRLIILPGDFNPEIAFGIIGGTKTFMLRLATELPEGTIST